MAKIDPHRLKKGEYEELQQDVLLVLRAIGLPENAGRTLLRLFTESEVVMAARRIRIARLLAKGRTHEEVKKTLRVGDSTIQLVEHRLRSEGSSWPPLVTAQVVLTRL